MKNILNLINNYTLDFIMLLNHYGEYDISIKAINVYDIRT